MHAGMVCTTCCACTGVRRGQSVSATISSVHYCFSSLYQARRFVGGRCSPASAARQQGQGRIVSAIPSPPFPTRQTRCRPECMCLAYGSALRNHQLPQRTGPQRESPLPPPPPHLHVLLVLEVLSRQQHGAVDGVGLHLRGLVCRGGGGGGGPQDSKGPVLTGISVHGYLAAPNPSTGTSAASDGAGCPISTPKSASNPVAWPHATHWGGWR